MLLAVPALSLAQSACTSLWGIVTTGGAAPTRLAYYNNSAGTAQKFTTLTFTLSGGTQANALAGDPATGLLYYFDRAGLTLNSINVNTNATATVGTVAPASPNTNTNIIGAVIDQSSNLVLMSTSGPNGNYQVATVSKTGNTTNAVWRTVTYAIGGGLPTSGGSGDLGIDKSNQLWLITNSAPVALYPLTLGITAGSPNGTITSSTVGASVTYATGPASVAGIATDPVSGISYFGGATANQIAYSFVPATANSEGLVDASPATLYTISDLGNCVVAPAAPSISKTFSPTYQALGGATTTLVIAIGNTNSVPVYLTRTFTDTFPAGMTVAAIPAVTSGACVASTTVTNVITATAGANTLTFAAGGRVPAGGCTITVNVTAAASASAYTNTIAAGDLGTTAGTNAVASSATYKVGTDFSAGKSQCLNVCGITTTASITVLGGQTLQYVLTVTNSTSGGTGSSTFTDTLPGLMTPVLSITASMVGGGSCTTASAVVSGSTQVTGTITNAPAGAACTVLVTTLVSKTQTVATNVTNTLTLTATPSTSDTNAANNIVTVPAVISPSALLTISKSNGTTSVAAGTTVSYTIKVVNSGPAAAPGTLLTDPPTAGLSCSTVTCSATAGASCPAATFPFTSLATGVQITPTFAANSTATFVFTCGITATGQ